MTNCTKKLVAFLLVFVLILGMLPSAFAAEISAGDVTNETAPSEPKCDIQADPQDETQPSESTHANESLQEPSEEIVPDSLDASDPDPNVTDIPEITEESDANSDDAMTPLAVSNCTATKLAIWWVNNTEINPEGKSDFYIYYEFPKGQPQKRKKAGLHTVKVNGEWKAAYCIEPGVPDARNYVTDDMTLEEWLNNPNNTAALSEEQLKAIGVALLYGQVERPRNGEYDKLANMLATQIIVWEISIGWREPYAPFSRTNDAFIRRFADGSHGVIVSSSFLDIPSGKRVKGIVDAYNRIVGNLERHYTIPSFTSPKESQAPEIQLAPNGNGTFSATITDSNGILDQYSFTDTDQLTFSRNGNSLTITATGNLSDTIVACTKEVPSVKDQVYYVWYNGSYQQMAACSSTPASTPVPAFFKITTPGGSLDIRKDTSDGNHLSGWEFGIYRDAACSDLISGPHISDSTGMIHAENLTPETVYVRENGHQDPEINAQYRCEGPNPQKVTIVSGQTASVSFYNQLKTGSLELTKETNTGENLGGWSIGLYYNETCTQPVPGSPFLTAPDGKFTITELLPGTYYAREEGSSDEYWQCDDSIKTVTIKENETARVSFRNIHHGRIKIVKAMATDGSPEGWWFKITDGHGNELPESPFCSDADGTILTPTLEPGQYTVEELIPEDSLYFCKTQNPQSITVTAGETAVVTFTNALRPGRISILKLDPSGAPLAGAEFLLEWSTDGQIWAPIFYSEKEDVVLGGCANAGIADGCIVSDADGQAEWTNLYPGIQYRITETEAPDGYSILSETAWEGTLPVDTLTVQLKVINSPIVMLPKTGSSEMLRIPIAFSIFGLHGIGALWILKRKEDKTK